MTAEESISFTKYPVLHELENYHRVELGNTCCTADSVKLFSMYIAESQFLWQNSVRLKLYWPNTLVGTPKRL